MIAVDEEYLLTVEDLALPDGYGVARHEGEVVFVPGALPGDRARVRIRRAEKRVAYGELLFLEEPSVYRKGARCAHAPTCRACELEDLAYEKQLEIKQNHLSQVLRRVGGIDTSSFSISTIVPSVDRYYYRSKIEFAFGEENGKTVVGLTERASPFRPFTGLVTGVGDCRLFSQKAEEILPIVTDFVRERGLPCYDPQTGKGVLSRLVLREAKETGEMMVNIVAQASIGPIMSGLASVLADRVPDVKSVYLTVGARPELLLGRSHITEHLGRLSLRVYPLSFFQPNPRTAHGLYGRIPGLARLSGGENLLGLYCGAGTAELLLSGAVKSVTGIDSSGYSIACAKENAATNGVRNILFLKARAESALERLRGRRPHVVLVDPPRAGMSAEAIGAVRRLHPEKLIYVSCNPATLARDLKTLHADYLPKEMMPFDFFPHTGHFEVLTYLEKR